MALELAPPIAFPRLVPLRDRADRDEVGTFRTPDGVDLRYTRYGSGGARAVVVAPGLFTDRSHPAHRLLAERLAWVMDVIVLDVRGHGESGGAFTWGVREPDDIAAFARHLRVEYAQLGGLGFSFGGYHVGAAAALHRPFDAVAMVATPSTFSIVNRHFLARGLVRTIPAALRRRRHLGQFRGQLRLGRPGPRPPAAVQLVERIAPTPLLIAHGTADWLLSTAHAHALYAHAAEPKRLLLVEGGLHAEGILLDHPERLLPSIASFFEEHLPLAASPGRPDEGAEALLAPVWLHPAESRTPVMLHRVEGD